MMNNNDVMYEIEDISRDLDMVVYRMEQGPGTDPARIQNERAAVRKELEQLRDRLQDLARKLI